MNKIPASTIKRLSIYYRQLLLLNDSEIPMVRSETLAKASGVNPAQIRKDLSYFGTFGKRGSGYPVQMLLSEISKILGTDQTREIVLVGAGALGQALISFRGFEKQGFRFAAIADNDPHKIGKNIRGHQCLDFSELLNKIKQDQIQMAILTVPAEQAQKITEQLVAAGIIAILNFTPSTLEAPDHIKISNIDVSVELKSLSFFLKNQ